MNDDWKNIFPITLQFDRVYTNFTPEQQVDVSTKIRKFYFDDQAISEANRQQLTNVFSDRLFNQGVRKCAVLMAAHVPVYTYQFAHNRGDYSILKWFDINKVLGNGYSGQRMDAIDFHKMFTLQVFLMLTKYHSYLLNRTDSHLNFKKILSLNKCRKNLLNFGVHLLQMGK